MIPVVELKGITKCFGTLVANKNINFDLMPGETHALVGENGAGKTTLMRILYGIYQPDEGKVLIDGESQKYKPSGAMKLGIAMVHQNFMQVENMSIMENVIMACPPTKYGFIKYKDAEGKISELLSRFGLAATPQTKLRSLCVGERQKVEIIKALYLGAKVLILDEPTAVLTPQETTELFNIIRDLNTSGKSIIFISHKLREVMEIGDRITVMRKGEISNTFLRGEVTEADIARAMIGKNEIELLQNNQRGKYGRVICSAKNLWYIDERSVPKLIDFSLEIHAGEILGIGGVEGNGQNELVNIIVGMKSPSSGIVELNGENITNIDIDERRAKGLGYISDDRMNVGLCVDADLNENIICGREQESEFSNHSILNAKKIKEYVSEIVNKFDIRGINENGRIKGMSGGNLQKIVLAREISSNPKLLIAAQPTRGLDIGAINFVRQQLLIEKERGVAVLLVSADMEELTSMSDRIIIMCGGKITGEVSDVPSATEEELGLMMGGITGQLRGSETNE